MEADTPENEPQIKAAHVPQHYSFTATPKATFDVIMALRVAVRELEVSPETEQLLDVIESAYVGDLPERITEPTPEMVAELQQLEAADDEEDA